MSSRIHSENRRASLAHRLALAPYSVWAVIFVAVPLVFVAYYAFTDESFRFTTENLTKFFTAVSTITDDSGATREVHTYLLIFWRSVKLAVISTAICLLMGYPHCIYHRPRRPAHAEDDHHAHHDPDVDELPHPHLRVDDHPAGLWPAQHALSALHLGQAHIIGTEGAVVVGMVYDYFPYMILPIYSVMAKMDTRLIEAARDLGCNSLGVLRRVIFPLSLPGVMSGITMVLIPSISTFYISQKLGNGKFFLIGDAIEGQYVANNLHFAAAIAFILMLILLAAMALMKRGTNKRVYGGV